MQTSEIEEKRQRLIAVHEQLNTTRMFYSNVKTFDSSRFRLRIELRNFMEDLSEEHERLTESIVQIRSEVRG